VVLITGPINFGPIPFRLFNSWMHRPGFDLIIKKAHESFTFSGPPDRLLMEKLKHFKSAIKQWVIETKSKEEESYNPCIEEMNHLDEVLESRNLEEEEDWIHMECKSGIGV
jgi:hypothetical protein